MDMTIFVLWAFIIGAIFGMISMYLIMEHSYRQEHKNIDRSMLDFAEKMAKERELKVIDFNLFEDAGGSFDNNKEEKL